MHLYEQEPVFIAQPILAFLVATWLVFRSGRIIFRSEAPTIQEFGRLTILVALAFLLVGFSVSLVASFEPLEAFGYVALAHALIPIAIAMRHGGKRNPVGEQVVED